MSGNRLLLKNLLITIIVPGTVAVYIPLLFARRGSLAWWPITGPGQSAGLVLVALGAAGFLWCVWEFAVTGRGTPAPFDAPRRLVIRGPYRYVRNPMYVSVLLTIVAWSLIFRAPILLLYAAAWATIFHLFVVFYEEPTLRTKLRAVL